MPDQTPDWRALNWRAPLHVTLLQELSLPEHIAVKAALRWTMEHAGVRYADPELRAAYHKLFGDVLT